MRVLITNTGHPELDLLAVHAARRDELAAYVRPWVYLGRRRLPPLPAGVAALVGKRARPDLAELSRIDFAATVADAGAVLAARAGLDRVQRACERRRRTRIDAAGAQHLAGRRPPDAVYANFGAALRTFTRARERGVRTVLSYPTVHHDVADRLGHALAEAEPALASTIDFHALPVPLRDRLSREIDLADRVLVASEFAASTFVEAGVPSDRLVVARFGTQPARAPAQRAPRRPGEPLRVGFCGQVGARKGFHVALRAMRALGPGRARLSVAGRYVGDRDVWAPFGVDFTYAGNLDRAGLAAFYASVDVLVLPTYFEGLPLGVLDALSYGVPAVVTDRGPGDAVRDGVEGFVVPVGDHDAVANALHRMAGDERLLHGMSVAALDRSRAFTWEAYAAAALGAAAG